MCGLLGAFGPKAINLKELFPHALNTMSHRGPDDDGVLISPENNLILGHKRLSILDISAAGHQPMKRGQDWIVFNGEIYNHLEIRQKHLGHVVFNSQSDTETLFALLQNKGLSGLKYIEGMFAAAWFDGTTGNLHLFRDPLGIKPLFYNIDNNQCLTFASEIKSLLKLHPSGLRLNTVALSYYLATENYPRGANLLEGIENLLPAEVLTFSSSQEKVLRRNQQFIEPLTSIDFDSDRTLLQQVEDEIVASVHSHLLSDVPIGVYLSGGIDSSLVASIAAKKIDNILGFTGYFETSQNHYDERPYARMVAKKSNIQLHEVKISPNDLTRTFDELVFHLDQPRMGMGSFSQFVVAQAAAKHRKVILAGHGGDELFAGYPLHKTFELFSKNMGIFSLLNRLKSFNAKEWPWLIYALSQKITGQPLQLCPKIWSKTGSLDLNSANFFSTGSQPLEDLDAYYRHIYIPGLLEVEDRVSMAHGLETRVPLWNQRLAEFAKRIPIQDKIKNGEMKYLLKKVAINWLPQELLTAPKRGFPTPLRLWFRSELKEWVQERLLNSNSALFYEIFPKEDLEKLIASHVYSPRPFALDELRAHKIWTALNMESWLRQFEGSIKL